MKVPCVVCSADDGSGSEAGDDDAAGKESDVQHESVPSEDGDSNMDAEVWLCMELAICVPT